MGILQAPAVLPGQVGIIGAMKYMVTTDGLSTITTAGYLNQIDLAVNPILASDVLGITYSYNLQTNSGTFEIFTVSLSNGVITLTQWANPGNVLLPVTSGDFAVFNGTSGQIKDSGSAPSAASQPFVVMSPGTVTAGHLVKFNDANGTVADQGVAMKSVSQAAVAGGAAAQTVTDAFCTTASCVIANWNDTTNAVSIQKVAAGSGSFVVTSSADPGASHLSYVIFK